MKKYLKRFLKGNAPVLARYIKFLVNISERNNLVCRCRDYTSSVIFRSILKILVTPYYLIKYFFPPFVPRREGLALVLIAKDEGSYIKEWLDFHIKQGVSQFIIYDNGSTDNFHEVLAPYIEAGTVNYETIKGKRRQVDAYNMSLNKYGHKFRYMGFIDTDEFIYIRRNIKDGNLCKFMDAFMSEHKNAGGLAVNWLIFGSSGHEKRPEGGVLRNFTRCSENDFKHNLAFKTICDPMRVLAAHVHAPSCFYRGFHEVNEDGEIIINPSSSKVSFEKIRINHYFCKSKEEFQDKMKRGKGYNPGGHSMKNFLRMDKNDVEDTEILSRM